VTPNSECPHNDEIRPLHSSAQRKAMMSVMAIFQQQRFRATPNSRAFIDLPSCHAYHCTIPRLAKLSRTTAKEREP
jgi:hypothetical protein